MPPLTNLLISASAGTGKTYQLSLRFLGLLALNSGNHPERLIAITFTRKAAGEFKDRILTDLAAGATDEAGAARLKERLWAVIKGPDGEPGLWPGAPEAWKEENLHRERFLHLLSRSCTAQGGRSINGGVRFRNLESRERSSITWGLPQERHGRSFMVR